MPVKSTNTQCPPEAERMKGLFRRAEDWERLTRLEFIVEELARDNERRDLRIDKIIETQNFLGETQSKMLRYARDIRMLLLGASGVYVLYLMGAQKVLMILFELLKSGVVV